MILIEITLGEILEAEEVLEDVLEAGEILAVTVGIKEKLK